MLQSLLITLLAVFAFLGCGGEEASKGTADKFMPDNNLWMEDGFVDNGMTEAIFNDIIDNIIDYYAPIAEKFQAELVVSKQWKSSTVNASANQMGDTWQVTFYGGLARRPEITPLGFATVICHELGHHFGGYPNSGWASNEGNSDTFATHVCLKKILVNSQEEIPVLPQIAIDMCDKAYTGNDRKVCYVSMGAAQSTANLLAALGGDNYPRYDTPDPKKVKVTDNAHPEAQCRFDTMIAGARCTKAWRDDIIPTSRNQALYNCTEGEAARPRCWYAP